MENKSAEFKFWFFPGGETRDNKFNVFTGSFISLMKEILGSNFDFIKGVYFRTNIRNVAWALNNAQHPVSDPCHHRITGVASRQLLSGRLSPETQLIIVSSSSGSVIAAQTACCLAEQNREKLLLKKPFHVALGASMVAKESMLFRKLEEFQASGQIGMLIYDELQHEGDNAIGVGSTTRFNAWMNAIGLILPYFSWKHDGPSFLNTHPVKGHLHRRRSQTVLKALDFSELLLVKKNIAGDFYRERAISVIRREREKLIR